MDASRWTRRPPQSTVHAVQPLAAAGGRGPSVLSRAHVSICVVVYVPAATRPVAPPSQRPPAPWALPLRRAAPRGLASRPAGRRRTRRLMASWPGLLAAAGCLAAPSAHLPWSQASCSSRAAQAVAFVSRSRSRRARPPRRRSRSPRPHSRRLRPHRPYPPSGRRPHRHLPLEPRRARA